MIRMTPAPGALLNALSALADVIERAIDAADGAIRRAMIDLVNAVDDLWSAIAADDDEYAAWLGGPIEDDEDDDQFGDLIPIAA